MATTGKSRNQHGDPGIFFAARASNLSSHPQFNVLHPQLRGNGARWSVLMSPQNRIGRAVLVVAAALVPVARVPRSAPAAAAPAEAGKPVAGPTTRPLVPKPLSENVKQGLAWLAKHQQSDGGWSQGEASLDQYREGEVGADK